MFFGWLFVLFALLFVAACLDCCGGVFVYEFYLVVCV